MTSVEVEDDGSSGMSDQLNEVIKRQLEHVDASRRIDRRGWTREQWVADARRLFNDLDGSVLDLVNGHVAALLQEIDHLRAGKKQ